MSIMRGVVNRRGAEGAQRKRGGEALLSVVSFRVMRRSGLRSRYGSVPIQGSVSSFFRIWSKPSILRQRTVAMPSSFATWCNIWCISKR